jgi:membrane fusion protein (multidrug efflux system)
LPVLESTMKQGTQTMKLFKSLRNLRLVFPAIIIICLMSFLNGCSPASKSKPIVTIVVVKHEKAVITTELPGRTSAYLVAEVRPQVGGIIQRRLFEEGSDVKTGDLLYQIDPAPYQAAYNKSKAELNRAEAAIFSKRYQLKRNKILIKSHSISQKDVETSESDFYTAQADVQACKAAVETAKIHLDYTKVEAPISGRIGKSEVTVGALVASNNIIPLATIHQIDPIFVDVTQSSADFLRLKRNVTDGLIKRISASGTKVKLFFEDGSPYPIEGEVKFRDLRVDQSTGSFILRIIFPNPEYALLPGMYVRAVLHEGIVENAILVPHQAVSRNFKGEPVVLIVDSSDKVEERTLIIDHSIGGNWLIKDGLKPGERLIMEGFQRIRPGMSVKIVPFESRVNDTQESVNTESSSVTGQVNK